MKFTCTQKSFSTAWDQVARIAPSRPSHPVLANILLTANEVTGNLTLNVFDLSLGLSIQISADVEEGGSICLPAKLVSDIASRLPDEDLFVSIDEFTATIKCSSGRYQVQGMDIADYPELDKPNDDKQVVEIPGKAIASGLRSTLFAASSDESKQILTGVHIQATPDGIEFAATDGHRLAVLNFPLEEETSIEFECTVPSKALSELMRSLPPDESITIQMDGGLLVCDRPGFRLSTRLLEGQYPNYTQLIPRQFARHVTVERKVLMGALERVAIVADQKNGIVKFTLDQDEMTISASAADVGNGSETIPAMLTGDGLEIAFNVKYILEGLKNIDSKEVLIQFNSATSPVVISPIGGEKMTYLLMPVQIRA